MNYLLVLLFLCNYFVHNSSAQHEKYVNTIHGYHDSELGAKRTFLIDREFENQVPIPHSRQKRSPILSDNSTIIQKVNYFNDIHKQMLVLWLGGGSNVIICLARDDPTPNKNSNFKLVGSSAVYISYDNGDTYVNKTDLFKMADGSYASVEQFYVHPKNYTHLVFADVKHKLLYVTTNYGQDIKRIEVSFIPSSVSFNELQPSTFVVLDNSPKHELWVTEDFGNTFKQAQNFVKSVYWIKESEFRHTLLVERLEPGGNHTILYSNDFFSNRPVIQAADIKDFYIKGDYLFTTKLSTEGVLELYVSYKLGETIKCVFDTKLEHQSYFIVDVTNNKALVVVSHSNITSHLYVSDNLYGSDGVVKFTLSLENVFYYSPNNSWHDTWIHNMSKEAFVDIYKVESLSGIYIASRVLTKPQNNKLGPQNLGSVITYDHGRSWRSITAPETDSAGQPITCSVHNECSLHLSQKFSQLYYSNVRSINIVSSKSTPGVIMAAGVLGYSLEGPHATYISQDAGLTWEVTLGGLYLFSMGDHGGILTAVKSRMKTQQFLYSTDNGANWVEAAFHDQHFKFYRLLTEPGENTTFFTIFGSLAQEHQWIGVKLNLINCFQHNCSNDDYKTWSPSQTSQNRNYIPCILGQQQTYLQRKPNTNCYNGKDFDAVTSMVPCSCDVYDYECVSGFVRSEKSGNCVRNKTVLIDPYKVPTACKPGWFYKRTKGYRRIQNDVCVDGFETHYLPEEISCPSREVEDFLLFSQKGRIRRFNLKSRTVEELPVKNQKNITAIEFDTKSNCVYWVELSLNTINRQCLNNSHQEILVSSDLESIEGMALDWISNNLYFVDGKRSKIELIRTDTSHSGRMRRTILGPDVLQKPRGIALHPVAGYMFWTDWPFGNASVNRADLDGSNIKRLFGRSRVVWPNGITIDYIAERIYWVDARLDYIASSDLHGDFFKLIISHNGVIVHPFAVAVFKNNIYWNDWKSKAMFSADKDNYQGVEVLQEQQTEQMMDLKVHGYGIRVGNNGCSDSKCSYICTGKPKKNQSTCLCPDGLQYHNGKCLCPGHVPPLANFTCPPYQSTCSPDHFRCRNGFCVPKVWKCDGEDNCGDSSDEIDCGILTCPPNHFVCGDGKCLSQDRTCDNTTDCADGSDELNCPRQKCPVRQFTCDNKQCISMKWHCDGEIDCADGSDEVNCPKQKCPEQSFTCKNGRCLPIAWHCDGESDCGDGSDEQNCQKLEPTTCKSNEFPCKAGDFKCIPLSWQCDGEKDCRDASDEDNCKNTTCLDTHFACGGPINRCIHSRWVCDGDKDCPDGRDEVNCTTATTENGDVSGQITPKNRTCQDWMYKCQNQKCIPYWWKCDEKDDCGDGSDEIGCPPVRVTPPKTLITTTCSSNQYQCAGGGCILPTWVCDGVKDCPNGSDEHNCSKSEPTTCKRDEFQCKTGAVKCIPTTLKCDGKKDCEDGTDEANCTTIATTTTEGGNISN